MQSIDQKPEVVRSRTFSGHRSGLLELFFAEYRPKAGGHLVSTFFRDTSPETGGAFRGASTKSRRLSGVNVFSGHISGRWRGFSQRINQKPEAAWSCTFSGYRSRSLREPRGRYGKAAGSGRALKLF